MTTFWGLVYISLLGLYTKRDMLYTSLSKKVCLFLIFGEDGSNMARNLKSYQPWLSALDLKQARPTWSSTHVLAPAESMLERGKHSV